MDTTEGNGSPPPADPGPAPEPGGLEGRRRELLLLAVLVEGGLVVLAWGLGWLLGQPPLEDFSWDGWGILYGIAGTVPLLLLFLGCLRMPWRPLANIRRFVNEVVRPLFAACTLYDLALISVLAGVGEEMFFRAVLQGALDRWLGATAALAIVSALFGLVHFITPAYAVIAAVMGLYLGALWMASGNLLVPMLAHGLYDFLVLIYLVKWRKDWCVRHPRTSG